SPQTNMGTFRKTFRLSRFISSLKVHLHQILFLRPWSSSSPPTLDFQTTQGQLKIEGRTEAGATVSINGNPVTVEDNGYFSLDVSLNAGLNTFQVVAQDSSGNSSNLTLKITLVGGTSTPTPSPTSSPSAGTGTATSVLGTFPDLQGHWAQAVISKLLEKGIVSGYPDGTFKPDQPITRAEFSTILCRVLGISPSEAGSNFADLQGHWAEKYIVPLVEKGLIKGYPDGTFAPDQPIKRCEVAAIMARALTLPPLIGKPSFSDIDTTHWAFGLVEAIASKGLIKGYPEGTFRPENPTTRAEACAIIARSQGF
ncbi:MAG: S-layer homology domain-containing protein, partial [bacterium]